MYTIIREQINEVYLYGKKVDDNGIVTTLQTDSIQVKISDMDILAFKYARAWNVDTLKVVNAITGEVYLTLSGNNN